MLTLCKGGAIAKRRCLLAIQQPFPEGKQTTSSVCAAKALFGVPPIVPRLFNANRKTTVLLWRGARSRGGLAFPPLPPVARVCFVRSSAGKGFASAKGPLALRSLSLPLRSFGFGSAGSLSGFALGSNRLRFSPSALHPPCLAPRGSPLRQPFPRFRSARGGFRALPFGSGRSLGR